MYPTFNAYQGMMPMPYQTPRQVLPQQQIMFVASDESFKTMQTEPNISFLAMNKNEPIVYVCQSDGAGKVAAEPYDMTPHKSKEQVAQANIENQLSEFNERLKRIEVLINGKPDISDAV